MRSFDRLADLLEIDVRPTNNGASVTIIGGGLAGTACAYLLRLLGHKVILLEGRSRLGGRGRTHVDRTANTAVETGGEFVGPNHLELLAYLEHFGVPTFEIGSENYSGPFSPILVDEKERFISRRQALQVEKEMASVIPNLNRALALVGDDEPWLGEHASSLDALSLMSCTDNCNISELGLKAFVEQCEANQGVHPDKVSLLGFLSLIAAHGRERFWGDTETLRIQGGISSLTDKLYQDLYDCVRFGTAVCKVTTTSKGCKIESRQGHEFHSDYVVLAAPPSVWPDIQFNPDIPRELMPKMGMNLKFFVEVDKSFQVPWGLNPRCISEDGLLQLIWDTTAGQDTKSKVISGFSGGRRAQKICALPEAAARELCVEDLALLMPGLESAIKRVWMKNWPTSQFTRAGYSYPGLGDVCRIWPTLRQGFGRLLIAGEAVAQKWSFMAGAVESGVTAAGQVHFQHETAG